MAGMPTGIRRRHHRGCSGTECRCGWEASVGSGSGARLRKTFRTLGEARSWRADAQRQLASQELRPGRSPKLRDAATILLDGMEDGSIRNRSGHRYKPSAIRSYREALNAHLLPHLGPLRLDEIKRRDVQALTDKLATSRSASTVRNALLPLRVIYKRAIRDGEATASPCLGIDLPARDETQRTPPTRSEAEQLLSSMRDGRRTLWATALYAGLRKGELRALMWQDIDFVAGVIRVERSMDASGEIITPKSRAGRRAVPVPNLLRVMLREQRLRNGGSPYVFGHGDRPHPLEVSAVEGVGLHDCRHAYASFMIAAGCNLKTLSVFMGHSSVTVTADRYGHLFPGSEAEAAGLLDRYLSGKDAQEDARGVDSL
jgi:integrase